MKLIKDLALGQFDYLVFSDWVDELGKKADHEVSKDIP